MNVHFIIHESFEAPGAYAIWAEKRGYSISYSRMYAGDILPQSIERIDLLIVMGGPQSPDTDTCSHFDSKGEQMFIKRVIDAGKIVIGICLGSQLIGESLGARYEHSPEKEIGKFPIKLTSAGQNHPLFSHFGSELNVGHWHNDMPGLTDSSVVIAISEGCPRQIVAYSDVVFGLQCHMELTVEVVRLLIENEDFSNLSNHKFVETPDVLLNHDYQEMNDKLFTFLDKLADLYQSKINYRNE
ncbi:type 1 glutamine amidotransferase [Vibrio parahaemolyticus]|uniref:type 1 glutamine amidotransferase n=1 Tax=Vibrio parahaemolyticus TaxID=670 RepID=UPI0011248502|nr:type 1 glutamine amidotransferase [Vibrio parahaemolyticus]TOD65695.1 GMP synthase [Vibrio parahaemolyticus]